MHVVTIPFDYEKLSPAEQAGIVPICIKATDDEGNPIAWGWFEAVERIQNNLRLLAKFFLDDVWRVSEITEAAVHPLEVARKQSRPPPEPKGVRRCQVGGTG